MEAKRILYALFLVSALAVIAVAQGSGATDSPKVYIESLTHDFGEMKAGTELKYTFIIKNQGKANLEIKNVAPS